MRTELRTDRDRRRAVARWRRSGVAAHGVAPSLRVSPATAYAWPGRFRADGIGVGAGVGDSRDALGAARLVELVPAADRATGAEPGVAVVEFALTPRCGRTL